MVQYLIVGLIVLASAWVVARKYLPKVLRRRVAGVAGKLSRRAGLVGLAGWLEADLPATASCGDGCGTCGSCGPAPVAGAVAGEFRISVESLRQTGQRRD